MGNMEKMGAGRYAVMGNWEIGKVGVGELRERQMKDKDNIFY